MTTTININAYSDALVVLGTAGVVVPIVRRWGINPVLGYLGAGAILGPLGLGSLVQSLPFLYWFTVTDAQNADLTATSDWYYTAHTTVVSSSAEGQQQSCHPTSPDSHSRQLPPR